MNGRTTSLHGVPVSIPEAWEDETVFRFRIPQPDQVTVPGRLTTDAAASTFQPNLVVRRYRVADDFALANAFERVNRLQMQEDPSLRVVRTGGGSHAGYTLLWQDLSRQAPGSTLALHQREILAYRQDDAYLCVFSITSTRQDLDELSASLGFSLTPTP